MTISVQTNASALVALQNLNKTAADLQSAQNRISTGLQISSAKDNASVWAIAQAQRADVNALSAVQSSLNRAASIADVAQTAGQSVSDLLNQIKQKVVAAQDPSLDAVSRSSESEVAPFTFRLRQKTLPVSMRNAMRPSAHTSVPGSIAWPTSVCSGAIQHGEPIAAVFALNASAATFAIPKSSTFTS